jgi:hypothetical protein
LYVDCHSTSLATATLLATLDEQIAAAEATIVRDERWETRTEVKMVTVVDPLGLADDLMGEEREMEQRNVVSVPVGAEVARAELERLLGQRRALAKPWA